LVVDCVGAADSSDRVGVTRASVVIVSASVVRALVVLVVFLPFVCPTVHPLRMCVAVDYRLPPFGGG
jgi:hypothetical protein